MSTENTQTDVSPSGEGTTNADVNTGTDSVAVSTEVKTTEPLSLDGMKKMSKEMDAGFSPKSVDSAIAETAVKPEVIPAVPTFTPNFKYKAALQEKEVDEFWRPLIKDADSEKKIKEALSKLDGFDFVKDSRDKVQKEFESLSNDYYAQNQLVERVTGAISKKDFTSAFRQLGLTDQDIFNYTQQKLQMLELPPEQRKIYEDAEQARTQQELMQEQMAQYKNMYDQQAVQTRAMQLDFTLSRPEVQGTVQNWDTLQGREGAFRDLVIQEANYAWHNGKQDLSASDAVQLVLQKWGKVINQGGGVQQVASQTQAPPQQTPQFVAPQAKPIIPSVNGKGTAPIKKVPKSIDDLKRMAKESFAESL